jgi:hypothetical protein
MPITSVDHEILTSLRDHLQLYQLDRVTGSLADERILCYEDPKFGSSDSCLRLFQNVGIPYNKNSGVIEVKVEQMQELMAGVDELLRVDNLSAELRSSMGIGFMSDVLSPIPTTSQFSSGASGLTPLFGASTRSLSPVTTPTRVLGMAMLPVGASPARGRVSPITTPERSPYRRRVIRQADVLARLKDMEGAIRKQQDDGYEICTAEVVEVGRGLVKALYGLSPDIGEGMRPARVEASPASTYTSYAVEEDERSITVGSLYDTVNDTIEALEKMLAKMRLVQFEASDRLTVETRAGLAEEAANMALRVQMLLSSDIQEERPRRFSEVGEVKYDLEEERRGASSRDLSFMVADVQDALSKALKGLESLQEIQKTLPQTLARAADQLDALASAAVGVTPSSSVAGSRPTSAVSSPQRW